MKRFWVALGIVGALWGGVPQQEIRIPPLGPYFKEYEPRIRKMDPIALMELYLDAREHAGCIVFDEQSKAVILKQAEALANGGNSYAMYLMGRYSSLNPWCQRAADAGDPYAEALFGALVRGSQQLNKANYPNVDGRIYIQKAYKTFKERAEKGDRRAMYQLWAGGLGNKFITKAEKEELKAKLFQGKDRVAYQAMYHEANRLDPNVIKQKEEQLKLVHESAEGGEIEAMRFLMFYYYEGFCPQEGFDPKKPRKRDLAKAWEWARRAWEAVGCPGEMPTPIDYYSEPWLKPGEKKKPKPKSAPQLPERTAPERH